MGALSRRTTHAAKIARVLRGRPAGLVTAQKPQQEGGLPEEHGFYAWWTKRGAIPGVPRTPHPEARDLDLFYVGIAPRSQTSASNLRSRVIDNHIRGNTGSSTFRFALAALLLHELDLHPKRTAKKVVLPRHENLALKTWQTEHLSLTWCPTPEPWKDEDVVVELMGPPLNLAGNSRHPFYPVLKSARDAFRDAAATRVR